MRWLRDNWIDALIFTVFAITVVGIVLFLTGVNPFKQKGPEVPPPTGGVVHQPAAGGDQAGGTAVEPEPQAPPVTVVPLLPGNEGDTTGVADGGAAPASSANEAPASRQQEPAVSNGGSGVAEPATPAGGEISLPGGPEEGIFRVSVGAFSNPENALALAEKLQKMGYPVRLEPVGRVTRVVVGPYSTRSQAAEAARKLSNYEPQVYRGDTPEPEGIYLQVGAYRKLSSAAGLVEKLRSAGIGPVVFYYQEPWLKVWVGPVDPNRVDEVRRKLEDLGLQVVEVH